MKKTALLTVIILAIVSFASYAAYGDYALTDITFGEPYNFGVSITDVQLTKGTTTYQDGKPVGITSVQGKPSKLQVIDVETGKLIDALEIPECESMCWQMKTAPDGCVWFGDYNKCKLYKYDPETKQITNYGKIGTTALVGIAFDDEGNVWLAGNPSTALYKFDVKSETLTEVLNKKTSDSVGLSIAHCNGKIYYVVNNTPAVKLYAYDIATGKEVSYPKPDSTKLLNYIQEKEDKIMIYTTLADDSNGVIAFDTVTETFTDVIASGVAGSRHFTPVIDGKVYFVKGNYYHGYDLKTGEVNKTNMFYGTILRGSDEHLVEIKNNPDFPGKSYVNFQYNGGMSVWNFQTGKSKSYTGMMEGSPAVVMFNKMGPDNKYYVTQFMGTKAMELDIKTGEKKYFPMSQATAVAFYGDNVYFANYAEGDLRKLDKTKE